MMLRDGVGRQVEEEMGIFLVGLFAIGLSISDLEGTL
jgi:hypothetical protein